MIDVNGQNIIETAVNNERRIEALEQMVLHMAQNGGRISQADIDRIEKAAAAKVKAKYGAN